MVSKEMHTEQNLKEFDTLGFDYADNRITIISKMKCIK